MADKDTKTPLRELGRSEVQCRATKGNFRACTAINSIIYQIGEDVPDRMEAVAYCMEYIIGNTQGIQIFDDKGEEQIVRGDLIEPEVPDEEAGFNRERYRNEVPPVQWQKLWPRATLI